MENAANDGHDFVAPQGDGESSSESKDSKKKKSESKKAKESKEAANNSANKAEVADQPPLEKLADDEKTEVAKDYIAQRGEDIQAELSTVPDTAAEAAALANDALLDNLQARLEEGQPMAPEMLDSALEETIDELGYDELEADGEPHQETEPDEHQPELPMGLEDESIPNPPTPPRPPASVPPLPPIPGTNSPSPNMTSVPALAAERGHNHAKYVLGGGIVGYLIGRRRGRLNTEAKMKPVQEKLQKQVSELHSQITERETKIRRLAIANAEKEQPVPDAAQSEKIGKLVVLPERPQTAQAGSEKAGSKHPEVQTLEQPKPFSAETASIAAVLRLAENVRVERTNLRKLYEENRLDERHLRQIIKIYLRGQSHEKLISQSLRSAERQTENIYSAESQPEPPDNDAGGGVQNQPDYASYAKSLNLTMPGSNETAINQPQISKQKIKHSSTKLVSKKSGWLVAAVILAIIFAAWLLG
ncbi:MAG: hypothetical protein ABI221_01485 [Candidatus Saccharimonadales bacterium]